MQHPFVPERTIVSSGKVLVTAFEPFGLVRGHLPPFKGNRSQSLLQLLRKRFGTRDFDYLVLPVSDAAITTLEQRLTPVPLGLFMMGEDLLATVRIETTAHDPNAQFGIGPLQVRRLGAQAAVSSFARDLAGEMKGKPGVSTDSRIGTFYCNRVYWRGQEWGRSTGWPTVFVHVGLLQSIESQLERVSQMLNEILAFARRGQKMTPMGKRFV